MDRHTDANHRHATTTLIGAGNNTSKNGQVVTEAEVDRGWKRHLQSAMSHHQRVFTEVKVTENKFQERTKGYEMEKERTKVNQKS